MVVGNTIIDQILINLFNFPAKIFSAETNFMEMALQSAFLLTKQFTKVLALAQFSGSPRGQ